MVLVVGERTPKTGEKQQQREEGESSSSKRHWDCLLQRAYGAHCDIKLVVRRCADRRTPNLLAPLFIILLFLRRDYRSFTRFHTHIHSDHFEITHTHMLTDRYLQTTTTTTTTSCNSTSSSGRGTSSRNR